LRSFPNKEGTYTIGSETELTVHRSHSKSRTRTATGRGTRVVRVTALR
jgi:hypothetical protein